MDWEGTSKMSVVPTGKILPEQSDDNQDADEVSEQITV